MKRSSIFSFNTLRLAPWPTLRAIIALVLLLCVSAFLNSHRSFFIPLPGTMKQKSNSSAAVKYERNPSQPKVLIVGSSRLMFMPLLPIAKALDIPQPEASNYSWPGSTYWDAWTFLKDHPEILQECEYFVMDLVPFRLLAQNSFVEEDSAVLDHVQIQQIPLLSSSGSRGKALLNKAIPVYSHQRPLSEWVKAAHLIGASSEARREVFRQQRKTPNINPPGSFVNLSDSASIGLIIESQFPDTAAHPLLADAFLKILDMLPEDATVLLIMPPYRSDVASRIRSTPSYNDSRMRFRTWIEENVSDSVIVQFEDSFPPDLISDEAYNGDGSHLTRQGLRVLSRRIGRTLSES